MSKQIRIRAIAPVAPTDNDENHASGDGDHIISVRMCDADLRFLDRWIARQPGVRLSRAEAIPHLVAEALARK
jgi:hypothetical protein